MMIKIFTIFHLLSNKYIYFIIYIIIILKKDLILMIYNLFPPFLILLINELRTLIFVKNNYK